MTVYDNLRTIVTTAETTEQNSHDAYMSTVGYHDLYNWFTAQARHGITQVSVHIEKEGNPRVKKAVYQSIQGQLGQITPTPSRSLRIKNDIGWLYFDMPISSGSDFQASVTSLVDDLIAEGLTVESEDTGATISDIVVSWK